MNHISSLLTTTNQLISKVQTLPVPTAVFAGHQVLLSDGYANLGVFPRITWNIGWQIVHEVSMCTKVRIFTLINDWQLNSVENQRKSYWENPTNALMETSSNSAQFLLQGLPHGEVAYNAGIHAGRISEMRLQHAFKKRKESVRALLNDITPKTNTCSINGCTSEYLELLPRLYAQGYRRLISFIPTKCRSFIEAAATILESDDDRLLIGDPEGDSMYLENIYLHSGFLDEAPPIVESDLLLNASQSMYVI